MLNNYKKDLVLARSFFTNYLSYLKWPEECFLWMPATAIALSITNVVAVKIASAPPSVPVMVPVFGTLMSSSSVSVLGVGVGSSGVGAGSPYNTSLYF